MRGILKAWILSEQVINEFPSHYVWKMAHLKLNAIEKIVHTNKVIPLLKLHLKFKWCLLKKNIAYLCRYYKI